ncbi:MAG: septal ring lytic transglycosylase RlpA family protein [Bacteroidaceae bacterium]|nr:septal ring lytic transglycosylase RlpA family protein [Bacteroidaceae bacterium]
MLCAPSRGLAQPATRQRGNASFYSDRLHGRLMSNGKPYHRDSMTCAHLRYPLGTWLHVRNLTNGKEVNVQVTDRGPYTRKFVIDLSRAAARALDIIQYGYRQVEITPFIPARVPYLYEPSHERPELSLGFSTDEDALKPYWQDDSLRVVLQQDTTLLHRAKQVREQTQTKKQTKEKQRERRRGR